MIIYRVAHLEFCNTSGEGAKRFGGRWNLPGTPALYGSLSIAVALLERLTIDPEIFSSERYVLYGVMEFDCPDDLVYEPAIKELPENWDAIPPQVVSQQLGTQLFEEGKLCFTVPSVVDRSSLNAVINPLSPIFKKIGVKTYPLTLDKRIIR
jgi:RES domain-containing protein